MVELHFTVNVFAESRFFVLVFEFLTFEKIKKCGEPKRTPSAYLVVPALSAQGGVVNRRTYKMNEMITPNPSDGSLMTSIEPKTQTATYAMLPTMFIRGCIIPERNCDFLFAS